MDIQKIESLWKKEAGNLIKPNILLAQDVNNKIYFVIEDKSTICFMIYKIAILLIVYPKNI